MQENIAETHTRVPPKHCCCSCLSRPGRRTWRCATAEGAEGAEDIAAVQAELQERRAELRGRLQTVDLNALTVPELRKCCREAGLVVKSAKPCI